MRTRSKSYAPPARIDIRSDEISRLDNQVCEMIGTALILARSDASTIKVNDLIGTAMSFAMKDFIGVSQPVSASKETSCELVGMRLQLMRALSHVHYGAPLVYRLRTDYVESKAQLMMGEYFSQNLNWLSNEVEPLIVPGTISPEVIGDLLRRFGWVRPIDGDESGYMRNFVLSEAGEKALEDATVWWHSLNWFEKAWLYVIE